MEFGMSLFSVSDESKILGLEKSKTDNNWKYFISQNFPSIFRSFAFCKLFENVWEKSSLSIPFLLQMLGQIHIYPWTKRTIFYFVFKKKKIALFNQMNEKTTMEIFQEK